MAKVINQINVGDNIHNIASTAYATCATAAGTAAKVAYIQGESSYASGDFVLTTGVTVHVKFTNANSVANPTLNINGTGAKAIKRYGTTAPSTSTSSSWYAGEVVALTYDGTYWQMNKGITDGNTDTKAASGDTSTKIYLVGATTQSTSGQTTYSHDEVYVDTDHFLTDTVGFRAGDHASSTDYKNGQILQFDTATMKNNTFTLPETSGILATQAWTKDNFVRSSTLKWSDALITNKIDLSGATINFNTDTHYGTHWTSAVLSLFKSSGGYELYVGGPPDIMLYKPDNSSIFIYQYSDSGSGTWYYTSLVLPDDFGYITDFGDNAESSSPAIEGLNIMVSSIETTSKAKSIIAGDVTYYTQDSGTIATREWVQENTSSGVSLADNNNWTGTNTFKNDGIQIESTSSGMNLDGTKLKTTLKFEPGLGDLTLTVPNTASGTQNIALTGHVNTWTASQSFNGGASIMNNTLSILNSQTLSNTTINSGTTKVQTYANGRSNTATIQGNPNNSVDTTVYLPGESGTLATREWVNGGITDTEFTFQSNNSFNIEILGTALTGPETVTIEWGDGDSTTVDGITLSHTYDAGTHTCKIKGCTGLNLYGNTTGMTDTLTAITVGNGVTSIGAGAFEGCAILHSVYLPKSLKTICNHAFRECPNLAKVIMQEGLERIQVYAFDNCTGLKEIVIPNSVTSIEMGVFRGCTNLQEITLPVIGSGENYEFFGTIFECFTSADHLTKIPASLKKVTVTGSKVLGHYAFEDCTNIEQIILPDSLEEISDSGQFAGCTSLRYIEFGKGLKKLGNLTCDRCSSLRKIVFRGTTPPEIGATVLGSPSTLNTILKNGIIVVPKASLNDYITTLRTRVTNDGGNVNDLKVVPDVDLSEDSLIVATTSIPWSEDLITNKVDLSGATLNFNINTHYGTHWNAATMHLFVSSGGYKLTVEGPPHIKWITPEGTSVDIYTFKSNGSGTWNHTSLVLPDDFGYITGFGSAATTSTAINSLNVMTQPICPVGKTPLSITGNNYLVAAEDATGTLATREWTSAHAVTVADCKKITWSTDLITKQTDLSGATIEFNTNTAYGSGTDRWSWCYGVLCTSSGGYTFVMGGPPDLYLREPNGGAIQIGSHMATDVYTWVSSQITLPSDFGYITEFRSDRSDAISTLNIITSSIIICNPLTQPVAYAVNAEDQYNTIATREWVEQLILGGSW